MPIITHEHLRLALGDRYLEGARYKLRETHASPRSGQPGADYRLLTTTSLPGVDSSRRMEVWIHKDDIPLRKPTSKVDQTILEETNDDQPDHAA